MTAQRERAEATGGDTEEIDRELDRLFGEVRESIDAEKRQKAAEASAATRFSSGVRRPIRKQLSQSARMNQVILARYRGF